MPNRRSHKKSRAGCSQCKKRHMKCDENRPACVNCSTAAMSCSFTSSGTTLGLLPSPSSLSSGNIISTGNGATSSHLHSPVESGVTMGQLTPHSFTGLSDAPRLNLEQIELIHHYTVSTADTLGETADQHHLWRITAVRDALRLPFSMYGILALSALHLAHLRPERRGYYRNLATVYHTEALSGLSQVLASTQDIADDLTQSGPILLFSGILYIYITAEAASQPNQTLSDYLNHMATAFQLSKGNRHIVRKLWYRLQDSEYRPIIEHGMPATQDMGDFPPEWEKLRDFMDDSSPSDSAYSAAIVELQRVYEAAQKRPDQRQFIVHSRAWFSLVPESYQQLLEQRRPEALIILAYHAAIMDGLRGHWSVGNTCGLLVHSIAQFLGLYWNEYLLWPQERIRANSEALDIQPPE